MFRFGLKLWSTNINYIEEALRLYKKGVYHYIELYVVPSSFNDYILIWEKIDIPYVIHAPHFRGGMNLAKKEKESSNKVLMEEAEKYADRLSADKIVVHPGIDGEISETARQLKKINDYRILIENKPYHALDDNLICNGTTPEEIKLLIEETKVGFCLDIGHALCSARAHNRDKEEFMISFLSLHPHLFHLTDGDINSVLDSHLHIGQGNYDLPWLLKLLPRKAMITIETFKNSNSDLNNFKEDVMKINQL